MKVYFWTFFFKLYAKVKNNECLHFMFMAYDYGFYFNIQL